MSGFTFIIVATIVGCRINKVIVLTKLGLEVVRNSFLASGWSLFPLLLKVLTNFPSTCHLGIQGHPFFVTWSIVPNALIIFSGVFNNNFSNSLIGF
jgi:hypothetical protein